MPERHPAERKRLLQACGLLALALSILLVRMNPLPSVAGIRLTMPWLMNDFRVVIYCPAQLLLQGGNPYNPAQFYAICPINEGLPLYLPLTFLLHAPFALLPFQVSAAIYLTLSLMLTVVLAWAAYRLFQLPTSAHKVILVAALLMLSRPGQWNLLLGQPTLELVLASYVALCNARTSPLLSGLGIALATYKPTFGVPLAILMAIRGDRRAVATGLAIAATANLPLLAVLIRRAGGFAAFAQGALAGHGEWAALFNPAGPGAGTAIDLPALFGQLTAEVPSNLAQTAIMLAVLGIAGAALRRIPFRVPGPAARLSDSIICLAILLCVHHHAYDLLLLTGPFVMLRERALPFEITSGRMEALLSTLFAVLAANYLGSASALGRLGTHPPLRLAIATLNETMLLAIFCVYVYRTLALTPRPQTAQALS